MMNGDGKWRAMNVGGERPKPYILFRVVDGQTEYHRTTPCNYAPVGRTIHYGYEAARRKCRTLNAAS